MIAYNWHTHSKYSDGKLSVAQIASRCLEYGLTEVAITDHARRNMFYGASDKSFRQMLNDVKDINASQNKITVKAGIELNLVGHGKVDFPHGMDSTNFDITVLGYHRGVFPSNGFLCGALIESVFGFRRTEKNTDEVIKALENNKITVLAHPNEYISLNIKRVATVAARLGVLMEINSRHVTMSHQDLIIAADAGAKFIISSDGHTAEEITEFGAAIEIAERAGVLPCVVNFNNTL